MSSHVIGREVVEVRSHNDLPRGDSRNSLLHEDRIQRPDLPVNLLLDMTIHKLPRLVPSPLIPILIRELHHSQSLTSSLSPTHHSSPTNCNERYSEK